MRSIRSGLSALAIFAACVLFAAAPVHAQCCKEKSKAKTECCKTECCKTNAQAECCKEKAGAVAKTSSKPTSLGNKVTKVNKAKAALLFNEVCPITGNATHANTPVVTYQGFRVSLCCNGCVSTFSKMAAKKKDAFLARYTGKNRRTGFPVAKGTATSKPVTKTCPDCEKGTAAKTSECKDCTKAKPAAKTCSGCEKARPATKAECKDCEKTKPASKSCSGCEKAKPAAKAECTDCEKTKPASKSCCGGSTKAKPAAKAECSGCEKAKPASKTCCGGSAKAKPAAKAECSGCEKAKPASKSCCGGSAKAKAKAKAKQGAK